MSKELTYAEQMAHAQMVLDRLAALAAEHLDMEEEVPEPDIQTENFWGCERQI
jgi:hypothetical protein